MNTRKLDADKLSYALDQYLKRPKRYTEERDGMEEHYLGEWVKYDEYKAREATLIEKIRKLEAEAANAHAKGYNEGKYAGPDYNMRNN